MFRHYHYLNSTLPPAARCYTALYKDTPVAFIAIAHIKMNTEYYRVTRLVVLPDYQGIGIGKKLLNHTAHLYTTQTKKPFYIISSNPQITKTKDPKWKLRRYGHTVRATSNTKINYGLKNSQSRKRLTITLQYKN